MQGVKGQVTIHLRKYNDCPEMSYCYYKMEFSWKKPILSSTGMGRALKANRTPVAPGVLKPWHDTEYTENKMQIQEYLLHLTTMITL